MNYDHKQSYKWQNKQDLKEEQYFDKPWLERAPNSFKKIGLNKFEMKVKFVYRPKKEEKQNLWWVYTNNSNLIQESDIVLWEEKINWYVKLNSKKKIDWILTNKFWSKRMGYFELVEMTYSYKGNEIRGFSNVVFIEENVYKLYLRERKLERISND